MFVEKIEVCNLKFKESGDSQVQKLFQNSPFFRCKKPKAIAWSFDTLALADPAAASVGRRASETWHSEVLQMLPGASVGLKVSRFSESTL